MYSVSELTMSHDMALSAWRVYVVRYVVCGDLSHQLVRKMHVYGALEVLRSRSLRILSGQHTFTRCICRGVSRSL